MTRRNGERERAVGVHRGSDRPVFQCSKTGLLYVLEDPPRRFVSVHSVDLNKMAVAPPKGKR